MRRIRKKNHEQNSKRARLHRKEAMFAGLPRGFAHPSHVAGIRRWERTPNADRFIEISAKLERYPAQTFRARGLSV